MKRPTCPACSQRPCAINYYSKGVVHYRKRCENCIRKNKGVKPREPRWRIAGYKKKPACDLCGFRAKYSAQLLVFHVDGNLNNCETKNLKTICKNCEIVVSKSDTIGRLGDLEPDA